MIFLLLKRTNDYNCCHCYKSAKLFARFQFQASSLLGPPRGLSSFSFSTSLLATSSYFSSSIASYKGSDDGSFTSGTSSLASGCADSTSGCCTASTSGCCASGGCCSAP